jgi:non-ribosomal peptide synthetase component F
VDEDLERINAAALLLARGAPPRPALIGGGRSMSYRELRRAVAGCGTQWKERGIEPGEVVMLRGHHDLDHVIAFLAAMWAGAVPVPLRAALAPDGQGAPQGIQFAVDGARPHAGQAHPTAATTWSAWDREEADTAPSTAVACEPWAPACWTEPRAWSGGNARVLPHRFALTLTARPGMLPIARAGSMLGVLRALRRGVTIVLDPAQP